MNLSKIAATAGCLALVLAAGAWADTWNRKTVVKFSGPVEIPGVHLAGWGVLPAGTYVFKIMDSQSNRHIVQIFSEDEKTVYATVLAIPNYRLQATDKTVITFSERPSGQPEALRAWFYPGQTSGEEFVYPKARAMELAKTASVPVLFTPAEMPAEVSEPAKLADAPILTEMLRAPVMAVQPTGEEVQLALVVTPPPVLEAAPMQAQAAVPASTLPETAGSLPMIGLFGLMALGGALALRAVEGRVR